MESEIQSAVQGLRDQESSFAVVVRESEERMEFSIRPPETERPSTVGVLSPGYPFYLEELNGKAQRLPRGSQVFVPVDREAEQALHGLKTSLEYLPKDMQTLVWHALLMPSLDARIDRLEMAVRGKTAGQELKPIGFGERLVGWLRKPVVYWPALAVALAALLGFGGYQAYRSLRPSPPPAAKPESTGPAIEKAAPKINEIARAIEANKHKNSAFQQLSTAHENDLDGIDTEKISALFKKGTSEDLDGLLLALIKLEVLKLSQGAQSNEFLEEPDLNATMDILAAVDPKTFAKTTTDGDLLESLLCQRRDAPKTAPPLPKELRVSGKLCKDFPLEKAIPGLKAIPAFINEYAAAAVAPASSANGN